MDIRSEIVRKNLMISLTSGFLVLFATKHEWQSFENAVIILKTKLSENKRKRNEERNNDETY